MYHIKIALIFTFLYFIVGGCSKDFNEIYLGETKDEVQGDMGNPKYRIEDENEVVWIYEKGQGGCSINSEDEYFVVTFTNDIVVGLRSTTSLDDYNIETSTGQ